MPVSRRYGTEFFAKLTEMDAAVAAQVAAGGCRHCGGPLHVGNYVRKPRGGAMAVGGEEATLRHSLCCGRRGCRRRALPPSLRFLGRRVYLEAVVIMATVVALVATSARAAVATTGVPGRTLRRWWRWWREAFVATPTWVELRARFVPPPPDESALPRSLVDRLKAENSKARDPTEKAVSVIARQIAPLTTNSVVDGSRFVRAAVAASFA